MDYFGLTEEEQREHEEVSHYHGKRIWAIAMLSLLKREGPETVRRDIDTYLRPEAARDFVVGIDGERLRQRIMALPRETFRTGAEMENDQM